jgi:hypothetical protein
MLNFVTSHPKQRVQALKLLRISAAYILVSSFFVKTQIALSYNNVSSAETL